MKDFSSDQGNFDRAGVPMPVELTDDMRESFGEHDAVSIGQRVEDDNGQRVDRRNVR